MSGGLELDWKREVAPPDAGQQFFASLDGPLGPAMLLRLETVHIHRQLGRSDHVGQINKFPARELRAIAKIQDFAERISLTASTLLDTRTPPETRGPTALEKPAAMAATGFLTLPRIRHHVRGTEQPPGRVHVVVDRQLHRNMWQVLRMVRRHRPTLTGCQIHVH